MLDRLKNFFNFQGVPGNNLLESPRTKIAHIEFTSRCNLRCVFCAASQPDYQSYDLDEKTIEHTIAALEVRHVDVVSVNGHGETTVYKDWHRYCNKMLDAGIPLHITSNFAKVFSAEELKTLSRFKSIEISCDTNDPELFKKLRRGADLRTICLNILRIRAQAAKENRLPPEISFSCVVSHINVLNLMDYVSFGEALGVTHFNFCNLTKYPDLEDALNTKHITEMPEEFVYKAVASLTETFEFLRHSNIKYDVQQGLLDTLQQRWQTLNPEEPGSLPGQPDGDAKREEIQEELARERSVKEESQPHRYSSLRPQAQTRDCLDPWQFIMVQANKDVLPCCWHEPIYSLGKGQSLLNVFNNTQFKELRRRLLTGELPKDCMNCPSRAWTTIHDLKRKVWHYLNPGIYKFMSPKIPVIKPDILRSFELDYGQGWYDTETNLNIEDPDWQTWKWTAKKAVCMLKNPKRKALLIIRGTVDKSKIKDQKVIVKMNEGILEEFIPGTAKFFKEYTIAPGMMGEDNELSLAIETDKIFVPSVLDPGSNDNRELGIQVYHLFFGEKLENLKSQAKIPKAAL
ncbi:MAG: radical SAM protein [Candidatus Aminicenantes bacterium]|nr:radical SAM protein [Candidatus Aminicenantes bacterium]NIM80957.1 radical SAM protein [Candidatus Aminicenantes bacterium]NIN20339.1 radical SAM protein [Candidatus Aminicenantes bacterium]NIN44114.1 radical SAM protein [Candidatus Aminicenantes bacterium]NIN86927.1 radical SAM protein [Candidatus Aminicenantes bacterium]